MCITPRDGFVGSGAGVGSVKLLRRVDEDHVISAMTQTAGAENVVLHQAAAQRDDSYLMRINLHQKRIFLKMMKKL